MPIGEPEITLGNMNQWLALMKQDGWDFRGESPEVFVYDAEYPDEGVVGPFASRTAAVQWWANVSRAKQDGR